MPQRSLASMQTDKKKCPWYCDDMHVKRQAKRLAERKWRKSLLEIDRQTYVKARVASNKCSDACKTQYYNNLFATAD